MLFLRRQSIYHCLHVMQWRLGKEETKLGGNLHGVLSHKTRQWILSHCPGFLPRGLSRVCTMLRQFSESAAKLTISFDSVVTSCFARGSNRAHGSPRVSLRSLLLRKRIDPINSLLRLQQLFQLNSVLPYATLLSSRSRLKAGILMLTFSRLNKSSDWAKWPESLSQENLSRVRGAPCVREFQTEASSRSTNWLMKSDRPIWKDSSSSEDLTGESKLSLCCKEREGV